MAGPPDLSFTMSPDLNFIEVGVSIADVAEG
jgi:hypothetical protein